MDTADEIYINLEALRKKLQDKIEISNDLINPDIIIISQELDGIINQYNKIQSIIKIVRLEF